MDFGSQCQRGAVSGMEHFLMVFSHVPEDRLHWTPAPTAKSPMRIAAHTAVTTGNFAQMMRDRQLPGDVEAHLARTEAAELAITTPAQMEAVFRQNVEEVVAALGTITSEEIAGTIESKTGFTMPMTFLMKLPELHAWLHAGQIDFLQTCWDDQVVHLAAKT